MTNSDPLDDVRIWRAGASASTYNAAGTSVLIRASHTLDLQFSIPGSGRRPDLDHGLNWTGRDSGLDGKRSGSLAREGFFK
jgi:hypothetical protein